MKKLATGIVLLLVLAGCATAPVPPFDWRIFPADDNGHPRRVVVNWQPGTPIDEIQTYETAGTTCTLAETVAPLVGGAGAK